MKRNKAHATFVADPNKTGLVEKAFMPEAIAFLQKHFDIVLETGDSQLNYDGADFIVKNEGEGALTVDLKVCRFDSGFEVLTDARKKDYFGQWEHVLRQKNSDYVLFINKTGRFLVDYMTLYDKIDAVPHSEQFFLKKDTCQTAYKAKIHLDKADFKFIKPERRTADDKQAADDLLTKLKASS